MQYDKFFKKLKEMGGSWKCDGQLRFVSLIARSNGLCDKKIIEFCQSHNVNCDCQVISNMDPETWPEINKHWQKSIISKKG